jgi:NADH dehydrogenase
MPNSPTASTPRTVAVTGATGFVGRYVIRELLARGYAVRALVRDAIKAREVLGAAAAGVELVAGDVCDDLVLAKLLRTPAGKPVDACVHLVGIIREVRGETTDRPQTFQRMHVSATQHVVDACRAAGVKRYLHMSAMGVGPEGKALYQQTKWEAERYVRRAFGDGTDLSWTIFRPALIHGPDGEFVQMMSDLCSGEVPPYFFLPYFAKKQVDERVPGGAIDWVAPKVQPVAVQDVALAFVEAIARPAAIGEIYNLVGPDAMSWPAMIECFRDTLHGTNRKLQPFFVPGEHAAIMATVAKTLGLGKLLPFDKGQAIMGAEDCVGDPTKAKIDLGITPRPFRETVRGYAGAV